MADRMPMENGLSDDDDDELVVAPSTRTLVDQQATTLNKNSSDSEIRDDDGINDDVEILCCWRLARRQQLIDAMAIMVDG